MTRHFVNRSGGTGSWYTGRVVMQLAQPGDEIHFVFADTKMEDEDLYRFLRETKGKDKKFAKRRGLKPVFHTLADGRDPWGVFFDVKYLGNTRIDPCSKVLKRDAIRAFLEENFDPADTICYIGIDWSEEHRFHKAKPYWEPFEVRAPLTDRRWLIDKDGIHRILESEGVEIPRLYKLGFAHNNCGGFCVKGGHGNFKLLLEQLPDRYAWHEAKEREFNRLYRQSKAPVTILRDRSRKVIMLRLGLTEEDVEVIETPRLLPSGRNHPTKKYIVKRTGEELPSQMPLSLRDLRLRIETGVIPVDEFDIGGCACFTPDFEETDAI